MGFESFGTVTFTTETKAVDFMNYLEQGKVMATRCRKCGQKFFPPRMDCPKCLDSDVAWFEITGNGKLSTYSVVHYGPTGFENEVPYILAVAEFADGVKVFSRLSKEINTADIKVGMSVKVVTVKLPENRISYEFQKA